VWRRFHARAVSPAWATYEGRPVRGLEDGITRVTQLDPPGGGGQKHGSELKPPAHALVGLLVAVCGSLAVWGLVGALVHGLLV
jgi:hypothetical protein